MRFNESQEKAIHSINGNIAVIATAGSGKTTVLTKRIENMVNNNNINPCNILAVTFSKKAKESIQSKLESLNIHNVNVETFHSLALKIIRFEYGNKYTLWTKSWEKDKLLQDICSSYCSKEDAPYNEINSFITLQKINMIDDINNLIYPKEIPFKKEIMKNIYLKYENYKFQNDYIEFDDFLNMANNILDSNRNTLDYCREKFRYVLSDEFPDISMSQSLLLHKINSDNTMIVGDPLQAIYSFRGGDSKYILDFNKTYNHVNIINLNTNYRCSKEIVTTANQLAKYIPDSKHKLYVESVANNPCNKLPEYNQYDDEYEEANEISNKIRELINNGYSFSDVAILARTNAQLTKIQSVFHDNLIPFDVVNNCLFTDLPEIKLLISYLKLSLHENDNESFEYLYNKPNRWLDKKFLEEVKEESVNKNIPYYYAMSSIDRRNWRFKNGIDEIYSVINYLQRKKFKNIGDMIRYLRERLNIDDYVTKGKQADDGSFSEQIENMNSFETLSERFESVDEFINYLDTLDKEMALGNNNKNKVKLSTIHRAKGLEFPIVFIIGCNDGLLPHEKNECVDDEKRLFYVGITRAEKELYLSSTLFYNNRIYQNSRFIYCINSTIKSNQRENKCNITN